MVIAHSVGYMKVPSRHLPIRVGPAVKDLIICWEQRFAKPMQGKGTRPEKIAICSGGGLWGLPLTFYNKVSKTFFFFFEVQLREQILRICLYLNTENELHRQ